MRSATLDLRAIRKHGGEGMNEPDLRCYHHPEREATGQCDRCGDYLCPECVWAFGEQHVCGACFNWVHPKETLWRFVKVFLLILVTLLLVCTFVCFGVGL